MILNQIDYAESKKDQLFKLTKKYRIGVIGEIYNIHVHKSVNRKKQHEFIEEIANFAINNGCYTCTLENTNS